MPPEFPNDVPVYPDAKLTAAASFISQGQQAWGMEWETPAATTKVVAFYEKALTTGDWTLTVTSGSSGVYSGTTARRSDTSEHGTIAVNNDNAFTMIALTLSTPAG